VSKRTFSDFRRVFNPFGVYITTDFSPTHTHKGQWVSMIKCQKMIPMPPTGPKPEIKKLFKDLLEARKLKSVIDRCYSLNEIPEAFRYYEKGHTRGRVIITI
jgi:NADPH:quinone reductase-like Zn-dependent oxidoreductase